MRQSLWGAGRLCFTALQALIARAATILCSCKAAQQDSSPAGQQPCLCPCPSGCHWAALSCHWLMAQSCCPQ